MRRPSRAQAIPACVLLLGLIALGALTILIQGSDASHHSQAKLADLEVDLLKVQGAPFQASKQLGGSPAFAAEQMRSGKLRIAATLKELRRDSPPPVLAGVDAPLRQDYAALDAMYTITSGEAKPGQVAGRDQLADAATAITRLIARAAVSQKAVSALLDEAAKEYESRGARSDLQLTIGSAAVLLLLVGAFAFLYRRAVELAGRLTGTLQSITDGFFTLDRDWRFTYLNTRAEELLQRDSSSLVGRNIWTEFPPAVGGASYKAYRRAADEGRPTSSEEFYEPLGLWLEATAYPSPHGLAVYFRDLTAQRDAERELEARARQQEAVARLGHMALASRDVDMLMAEVAATVAGTLDVEFSRVMKLGADGRELTLVAGVGWHEGVIGHASVLNDLGSYAGRTLRAQVPAGFQDLGAEGCRPGMLSEHGVVSGTSVVIEGRDRPFGVLGAHSNRTRRFSADDNHFLAAVAHVLAVAVERHHDEEVNRHAALHDPLTGLANRTLALERLSKAMSRRRRDGTDVAVLIIDLDRFKLINDSLGHGTGDELLVALAPRLRSVVRANETIGRFGGDEFVVVCEGPSGARDVLGVADRLSAAISRPVELQGGEHFITASIGIALTTRSTETGESLLRDADAAMYRAKQQGPGRSELFDDAMRVLVSDRLRTESDLRRALERDQMKVYYQPIIDARTGQPRGAEALVRWDHPERGLVPPGEFIPIAEETGLIHDLGRFVLETASAQCAEWQRRFDMPLEISVNVSGRQIANPQFPAEAAAIAERSGLRPGTLMIEVTESVLIEEAESPVTVLNKLRKHGLRLVLDDFGTGYSSLSYLKHFPIDGVKIDRSFVAGLFDSPMDTAIVRAVVDMSRAGDITVVAEGVETEEQQDHLVALGCERLQGFLFSRPIPAEHLSAYLAEHLLSERAPAI
jgi:diguanylate cyclase (GGDEF)-like protein